MKKYESLLNIVIIMVQMKFKNSKEYLRLKKLHLIKSIYHQFNYTNKKKKIIFVIGCQRSGTTMLMELFDRDLRTKVYPEFSKLSNKDAQKIRLNPMNDLEREFNKQKSRLIILKPLVETQNVNKYLNNFSNSLAIFLFRHYRDVANSNLKHFGTQNGINNLKPIIKNEKNNWRSEFVSEETKKIINKFYNPNMNPYDAAALFWYTRNILFFELNMNKNEKILLCNYSKLVSNPSDIMFSLYYFFSSETPKIDFNKLIYKSSVGKGKKVPLNPKIDILCKGLYKRFINHYKKQVKF